MCCTSTSVSTYTQSCETLWTAPMDWKNRWVELGWFHGWGLMTAFIHGNSCILGSCPVRIASLSKEGGLERENRFIIMVSRWYIRIRGWQILHIPLHRGTCIVWWLTLFRFLACLQKPLILLDARRYATPDSSATLACFKGPQYRL